MAVAKFFLKEPKSKEETLIYLFFSYNNKRLKYSTGEKIKPTFWNKEKLLARETTKFPEYPEFNARLKKIKSVVFDIHRELLNDETVPTNELLKKELDKRAKLKGLKKKDDISIVPLAIPFLSGPGAIATTVVLLSQESHLWGVLTIISVILLITLIIFLVLKNTDKIVNKFLGHSGIKTLEKVMGIIILCIGVQFILNGLREYLIGIFV